MPQHLDPAAVFEGPDNLRRHGDPADIFDIPPGDRLPPSDNGQCFEHRARIARRLFGIEPFKVALHFRAALKAPAAGEISQLQTFFRPVLRSEEHTSELQSLMRISYAVFCLKKKKTNQSAYK